MKKALRKNWIPKIVSLLLAIAIWFLIKRHLEGTGEYYAPGQRPPKARIVEEP